MASRLSSRAHSYSNQRRQYSATNPTLNEAWQLPSVIRCNTLVDHFVNISTTSMRIRITIYIHIYICKLCLKRKRIGGLRLRSLIRMILRLELKLL